jgi:hypothetical protein
MSTTIAKIGEIVPGSIRVGGVSFADQLNTDETITGTPTAVVSQLRGATDADGIATSSVAANTATATVDGQSVAIGEAVMFTITAAADAVRGAEYQILVTATTTEGQTLKERVKVVIL